MAFAILNICGPPRILVPPHVHEKLRAMKTCGLETLNSENKEYSANQLACGRCLVEPGHIKTNVVQVAHTIWTFVHIPIELEMPGIPRIVAGNVRLADQENCNGPNGCKTG
jgi:hypothetical protein